MMELTLQAKLENLDQVIDFVEEHLLENGCPMKTLAQLQIAVEEIYVNIANYAYQSSEGTATIQITVNKEPIQAIITFMDNGLPFNPLLMEAPDTTLSAENRPEGGLGIFMVKNIMDEIKYMYEGEKNILTMCKNF